MERRTFLKISGLISGSALLAACGGGGDDNSAPASGAVTVDNDSGTLRLGYFPNLTHVQPNVGIENGFYAKTLGESVKLETKPFNAGSAAIEALFAGAIDATYIGPSPSINGYVQSQGKELRIVAGATSGGVLFITRPESNLNSPADFAKKKIATPQLGNTQDVAVRAWLRSKGLAAKEQGGNVTIVPTANAQQIALFQKGDIDAAWAPEPWGTRLIQEAGGKLYLDERDLWPGRQFVITNLIVRTRYMQDHPGIMERLLRAHVEITDYIRNNEAEAKSLLNRRIEKDTNAAIPVKVIDSAWINQEITFDPIASSLLKAANDAYDLGYLEAKPDLKNIYDLTLLNKVLRAKNLPEVEGFA